MGHKEGDRGSGNKLQRECWSWFLKSKGEMGTWFRQKEEVYRHSRLGA